MEDQQEINCDVRNYNRLYTYDFCVKIDAVYLHNNMPRFVMSSNLKINKHLFLYSNMNEIWHYYRTCKVLIYCLSGYSSRHKKNGKRINLYKFLKLKLSPF